MRVVEQIRTSFVVRLPADVKAFIAEQARLNGASQNSEIVRAIRERMDRAKVSATVQTSTDA